MKRELSIDIETFSSVNLKDCGIYKYIESPDFEILLFAWAFDNEKPSIVNDLKKLPQEVIHALKDPSVIKCAFNAAFEINCIEAALNIDLDFYQWDCTMVRSMMLGLPASLDMVGRALNLDTVKDTAGKALITFFTKPCKPTKTNNYSERNFLSGYPDKADAFAAYCIQDVVQERKIRKALNFFKSPEKELYIKALDHKINKKGITIDIDLVKAAIKIDNENRDKNTLKAIQLTGLQNPRSVAQLKGWFEAVTEEEVTSLNKKELPKLKGLFKNTPAAEVLALREELSKSSTKKYNAMLRSVCDDGKAKGLVQYYGAARTGRWGGRLIQVHNLKRNTMEQLDLARKTVLSGNLENLQLLFDSPSEVLSQLIRTALIASPGNNLICADFSAIEARVTAWLADEKWRIKVFKSHGKIYEASASMMFKIPIEKVTKGSDERQKGKVSELALGFGGGPEALKRMGALEMGIPETELPKLVKMWRNASPAIVRFWKEINDCAIQAVKNPGKKIYHKRLWFITAYNILWIKLPSGRCLTYYDPKLIPGKWDTLQLTYLGVDQYTKRWERLTTYGGKLTENIVQAVARDLLAESMLKLDYAKFNIVMHVHDEVIIDHPEKSTASAVIKINKIMSEAPQWADGLPLNAECFITKYYKKE